MNRYKIHNQETDNRYEITDADLDGETLQERLERKRNAYGESPEIITEDISQEIADEQQWQGKVVQAWDHLEAKRKAGTLSADALALFTLVRALRGQIKESDKKVNQ